jgi:hypothetical protein
VSAPRIALGGVVRQWDGAERTGLNSAYVCSVLAAGGVPVMLSPLMGPAYAARALDGVGDHQRVVGQDPARVGDEHERAAIGQPVGAGDVDAPVAVE